MRETIMKKVTAESVKCLPTRKNEPSWLAACRARALELFGSLPAEVSPLYAKYANDFEASLELIPPPTPTTQRVEEAIKKLRVNNTLAQYQVEAHTTNPTIPDALKERGLIFTDINTAIDRDQNFFEPYFLERFALLEKDKFAALNTALFSSGFFLNIPEGIEVTMPLRHVTAFDAENRGLFEHSIVIANDRSKCTIIEELHSTRRSAREPSTYGGVTEIRLGDAAEVTFAGLNHLGESVNTFINRRAIGGNDSRMVFASANLGGKHTRSRLESVMRGRGASSENIEVAFGTGAQSLDMESDMENVGPDTVGHAVSKGVAKDRAKAIFKGMIRIEQTAKNARAYLSEHGMIIGREARVDAIPGLEIGTNEVRATHAASVAQIGDEQTFYLMSRGLSEEEAKKLIIAGFFEPAIERVPVPLIQRRMRQIIDLKWSDSYDFEACLKSPDYEEQHEAHTQQVDLFEGHYKYR